MFSDKPDTIVKLFKLKRSEGIIHIHTSIYWNINENFIQNSLSFTPNDCATLWECIEEVYEEHDCEDSIENFGTIGVLIGLPLLVKKGIDQSRLFAKNKLSS